MFNLPKKQVNINAETELLPTVQSPFEKYLIPIIVVSVTLLVTIIALLAIFFLRNREVESVVINTKPIEEVITESPFAPKENKPIQEEVQEPLDNQLSLATGISIKLDKEWHTLTTEDSSIHSMVSFVVTDESTESTEAELVQGEIEAYTKEHVFEDVMQTLAKSKEEFSTQTVGGYNVLVRNVYLLTGNAIVGEWKQNDIVLLVRVFASSMEEARKTFSRIAETVVFK